MPDLTPVRRVNHSSATAQRLARRTRPHAQRARAWDARQQGRHTLQGNFSSMEMQRTVSSQLDRRCEFCLACGSASWAR